MHILTARDNPRLNMDLVRSTNGVEDDEGEELLTTLRLLCDSEFSEFNTHGYAATLACTPAPTGGYTLAATLAEMYAGITESASAITGTFNNGTDYGLTLTVSNGYESASASISVLKSFANVHLSGCATGGVAFGKFSASTAGSPLFECEYPAVFTAGIRVRGDEEEWQPTPESGFSTPGTWGGALTFVRRGKVVSVSGSIQRTTAGKTTIAALPAAWLPRQDTYFLCVGTGSNIARVSLSRTDEIVDLEWYHACNTTTNSTAVFSWLDINGTYLLD